MNEHGDEPVRGLPEHLPEGEHILWQGSPDWRVLARTALHAPLVAGYFGLLTAWNLFSGVSTGEPLGTLLIGAALTVAGGAVAVGLLALYAVLCARSTVYTVTNKRFVLRHGVALSKIFNIPFPVIASAGLKVDVAGAGDIPVQLTAANKVAYPHLWPHVRPWRFSHPEPMIRAVADAAAVARTLSDAVQAAARQADRPFAAEAVQGAAAVEPPRASAPAAQPVAA
jgi:hypothetical protein